MYKLNSLSFTNTKGLLSTFLILYLKFDGYYDPFLYPFDLFPASSQSMIEKRLESDRKDNLLIIKDNEQGDLKYYW